MDNYAINGYHQALAEYETPFADVPVQREEPVHQHEGGGSMSNFVVPEFESPFAPTFETAAPSPVTSPVAGEFVQFLSELQDSEFENTLYEMAAELEDTWSSKVSNETAMGERFEPFATQQAQQYFMPLLRATDSMIDRVSERFSGGFSDQNEAELERFFSEMETTYAGLTPAQEQFLGSIFNKVKSVVKTGVDLAKKGISAVGNILPINLILNKLKGLVRPLLDRVLRFAIGKLPRNLQPHAQALAKKFLNLEAPESETQYEEEGIDTTAELELFQAEFDGRIANLVFSPGEAEAEQLVLEYEASYEAAQRADSYETGSVAQPSLEAARQQFVQELKNLAPGESPAPAIERFLPAAIMALQPVVKMGISIIGRQRIIDFLANLLAQLVGKYIPAEVAKPLASKIIDLGMSAIGFETHETNKANLAYEAIASTITDTVRNMGTLNEALLNDQEALAATTLEAFENAVADNFPSQYIREELRTTSQPGVWVLKPRTGGAHKYKKYSRVFTVTIDSQTARSIKTFRGLPLANFLKDKLGLDPSKPVQARVHLFEAIDGSWLSHISKHEKLPGLSSIRPQAWMQFHPLTIKAATLLLKEPALGRKVGKRFTKNRHRIAVGQRFYFLEISGSRVRVPLVVPGKATQPSPGAPAPAPKPAPRPAHSSDIQGVLNFIKSEIRINYFFSEEEAREVVEKLNRNDYLGAALKVRSSVRNVLHGILVQNVGSKVKIVHEAVPELFLDNYAVEGEEFVSWDTIKRGASAVKGAIIGVGKDLIKKIVEKLVEKLAELAYQALVNYFKARAAEFKAAQAQPKDGVTVKIIWINVPGMSTIRAVVNAIRGNLSVGNLTDLALPNIPTPEVQISAGKNFD